MSLRPLRRRHLALMAALLALVILVSWLASSPARAGAQDDSASRREHLVQWALSQEGWGLHNTPVWRAPYLGYWGWCDEFVDQGLRHAGIAYTPGDTPTRHALRWGRVGAPFARGDLVFFAFTPASAWHQWDHVGILTRPAFQLGDGSWWVEMVSGNRPYPGLWTTLVAVEWVPLERINTAVRPR